MSEEFKNRLLTHARTVVDHAGRAQNEEETKQFLILPFLEQSKKREGEYWPRWLTQKGRCIETVISQLVERYNTRKVWARDRWHLTSRFLRKVLSHTMAVHFCQQVGLSALRFSELFTD